LNVKDADLKSKAENTSRNIWKEFLRMWVCPERSQANDMLPVNPEGDEAQELSTGSIRIHT